MQEQPRLQGRTHMLNEIREQPEAVRRALANTGDPVSRVAQEARQRGIDVILLAARGTSDHAALYGQYLFQYLNGIPVALATPSLFTLYGASLRLEHALVIGISQSGESTDIVQVVERAREAGALTVGITNIEGSSLAKTAQHTLLCHAGLERSVAATKTYTTTCAVLAMLAASLPGGEVLRHGIQQIPDLVTAALQSEDHIARLAERYVFARDCVVLGRVFQYSTARETALKLEETCYIVSTPFSTADFRHGPAALIERGLPVILFAPPGRTVDESLELLQLLHERGADCMVITEEERLLEAATNSILLKLPAIEGGEAQQTGAATRNANINVAELLAPIAYMVPGQLFAQYVALAKGLNPDQPRGLTKVTRTL
ncbi:MAG TPA: SIS domain-containing protein [Ktedonobacteraceae bacterium]|nr:SIS domain-containing protein [Ktedonobacteraceae bacterium]